MPKLDLTSFLPEPLELEVGNVTLVSPVPGVEKGKKLVSFVENADNLKMTEKELAEFLFTPESIKDGENADIPSSAWLVASTYATMFWLYGEEVATLAITDLVKSSRKDIANPKD